MLTFCACATVFGVLAFGETLTGRLVDAACYSQHQSATSCDPTSSTVSYSLIVSGKEYKLDDEGKVAQALKSRADRATEPDSKASNQITAKVTGTQESGNVVKVETIEVQ
jgi:hypothetical protein